MGLEEARAPESMGGARPASGFDPGATLSSLLRQILLTQARELARHGAYAQAESLLENFGPQSMEPQVLDLRARIRAQQGRLLEATQLWEEAAAGEPADSVYRTALDRIAQIQRRSGKLQVVLSLGAAAVFLILLVISISVISNRIDGLRQMVTAEIGQAADKLARMAQGQVQPASTSAAAPPGAGSPPPLDLELNTPGVSAHQEANTLVLTFDAGLFENGTQLKPRAKKVLWALGQKLLIQVSGTSVHVIGHTDDLPLKAGHHYKDNPALGMARAMQVVEYLRSIMPLPPTMFSVSGMGAWSPPYPNDTQENRARNRTVTINITRR